MPSLRRTACVTMCRDETFFLRVWAKYYGDLFGAENLYIIDHASEGDRSIRNDLLAAGVNFISIPHSTPSQKFSKNSFDQSRFSLITAFMNGLRSYFDIVIYNDTDEIYIPDPEHFGSLKDYIDDRVEPGNVYAGIGVEVFENVGVDAPIESNTSLFMQRPSFVYRPGHSKPHLTAEARLQTH